MNTYKVKYEMLNGDILITEIKADSAKEAVYNFYMKMPVGDIISIELEGGEENEII